MRKTGLVLLGEKKTFFFLTQQYHVGFLLRAPIRPRDFKKKKSYVNHGVRNDLFSDITRPGRAADAPGYGGTPHPAGIPFGLVGVGGGEELLYVCFM